MAATMSELEELEHIRPSGLEWIRVADLQVDAYVQRTYSDPAAKNLAEHWNESKLGELKASKRANGLYYVIDGQHRRGALLHMDRGASTVPVIVYEGLTLRQEAEMFVAQNHESRRVNPLDVHRLLVVAEEPEAVAIQKVVDEHGLTLAFGGSGRMISAVSALRWLYRTGGVDLLDLTLRVVEEAWGHDNRDSRDGTLLKALGFVLANANRHLDVTVLADKLGKSGKPGQLVGDARTYRSVTKRSLWLETAHAVLAVYNRGRTSRRIELTATS